MIFNEAINRSRGNVGDQLYSLNSRKRSPIRAIFVYGNDVDSSYPTRSLIPGKEFASIQTVRKEIAEIQRNSVRGYDQDGKDFDRDAYMVCTFYLSDMEAFVCKEGVFRWAYNMEDFEFIGTIEKVISNKTVTFLERTKIEVDEFTLHFEKDASFYLDGEYITYDSENDKPIVMLVVQTDFTNPIAIPFNNEIMVIGSQDLITIK